ncbi:MAG TPA: hypothetical protein VHI10_12675 [Mycobacterium sp.]|nr:hypothetical protein [Mycobacterium sp.]
MAGSTDAVGTISVATVIGSIDEMLSVAGAAVSNVRKATAVRAVWSVSVSSADVVRVSAVKALGAVAVSLLRLVSTVAFAVGAVSAATLPDGVESAGLGAVDGSVALSLEAAALPGVVVTVVFAPPLAWTSPLRGSPEGTASGVDPPDGKSELESVECAGVAALLGPVDDESVLVAVEFVDDSDEVDDDEVTSDDELDFVESSVGDAPARPGAPATAAPTPSATASAPTRPMYLAYNIILLQSVRPA